MEAEFIEDLASLCHNEVHSFAEASTVLGLLSELIAGDLHHLSHEDQEQCWAAVINSDAYQLSIKDSRQLILQWLVEVDKLHTERLNLIGELIHHDSTGLGASCINLQKSVVHAVIEAIWTYRFTRRDLVALYLMILYQICVQSELTTDTLEHCISDDFILFLYREIQEHEQEAVREAICVILGLNDQFMLHNQRGKDNRVFFRFQESSRNYISFGGTLVWMFNRCGERDQDLKIFVCKFLYLMFTTSDTAELLYTNDLTVLIQILIRELHDLPLEAVHVRAMYLRLLRVIIKHSTLETNHSQLRGTIVHVLRLTIECAESLEENDRLEIIRLSKACLSDPWLQWSPTSSENVPFGSPPEEYSKLDEPVHQETTSEPAPVPVVPKPVSGPISPPNAPAHPASRPPAPPPPRRLPPRRYSASPSASIDSKQSMVAIEHFRPPPPPPPPPPRGRRIPVPHTD